MLKRSFKFDQREVDSKIKGYAFRFSETISYMGQLERFSPDLNFDLNSGGVFLLRDHNPGRVLARVGANLKFEIDKEGLLFEADYLDTELWRESRELIKKGVLNGASVGFSSIKERMQDNTLVYERIKLFEVSIVSWPAYSSSEVNARKKSLSAWPPEIIL